MSYYTLTQNVIQVHNIHFAEKAGATIQECWYNPDSTQIKKVDLSLDLVPNDINTTVSEQETKTNSERETENSKIYGIITSILV